MGAPRARANIATCEEGEPAASSDGAAARPVSRKKGGRRDVFTGDDRTAGDRRDRIRAAEMREHAVADIDEICGAGTEIFIFRGAIACDLRVERRAPGLVGCGTRRDGVVCRLRQRIVFDHRDLEFQDVRHFALNCLDQSDDLGCRSFDRRLQRGRLLRWVADIGPLRNSRAQQGHRPDGETRRGGTAGEMDFGHRVRPRQNHH